MSVFTRKMYEIRFEQAVRAVKGLATNRVLPLQWAVWEEIKKWPLAPSIDQLRVEAQLIVNSNASVWSGHPHTPASPKSKKMTPLEKNMQEQEASLRRRLPHLRKSTMDTMTRVRFLHYIGQQAYDELPD
jgi:hypothetical protein